MADMIAWTAIGSVYLKADKMLLVSLIELDEFIKDFSEEYKKLSKPNQKALQEAFASKKEWIKIPNPPEMRKFLEGVKKINNQKYQVDFNKGQPSSKFDTMKGISAVADEEDEEEFIESQKPKRNKEYFKKLSHQIETGEQKVSSKKITALAERYKLTLDSSIAITENRDFRIINVFNRKTLPSYKEQPFTAEIIIENKSKNEINEIWIETRLVPNYKPPKPEEITILINGQTITGKPEMFQENNGSYARNSEESYEFKFLLQDLIDTEYGCLKPEGSVKITLPLIADTVTPDDTYKSYFRLTAYTHPAGPPIIVPFNVIEIPVVHERLEVVISKSIEFIQETGDQKITYHIENKGKPLNNYFFQEYFPMDVDLVSCSHKGKIHKKKSEKQYIFAIESLKTNETFELDFILHYNHLTAS